jgi:hypothetical protein
MTKQIWINLPVKDLDKSTAFFTQLGFGKTGYSNNEMSGIVIGEHKVAVMLILEPKFKSVTENEIVDTSKATEVMFSIDAESREEVDEMAKKAENAGGTVFSKGQEIQGWMYGCGFCDLDGHRWNVLYMDMEKMPKS